MIKTFGWLKWIPVTIILLAYSHFANATYVRFYTSNGSGSTTSILSGDVRLADKLANWAFSWSAGESRSSSVSPTEITKYYELGVSYTNEKFVDVYLGGEYEKSEVGEVQASAPVLTVTKKWKYGDAIQADDSQEDSDAEAFEPSFSLSLTYKSKDYLQKPPRSTGKDFKVQQTYSGVSLSWDPIAQFSWNINYTTYNYDQDVVAFYKLVNLTATRLIRGANLTDGLASTLQGFYDYEYGTTFTYNYSQDTSVDLNYSRSLTVVSPAWDTTYGIGFSSAINDNWTYSLGLSTTKTDGSTSSSLSGDGNISYYF